MTALHKLQKLAQDMAEKYDSEESDEEPQGLRDEVIARFGPNPPVKVLVNILQRHGIRAHAFGHGIYVYDTDGAKNILPSKLDAVLSYLGY